MLSGPNVYLQVVACRHMIASEACADVLMRVRCALCVELCRCPILSCPYVLSRALTIVASLFVGLCVVCHMCLLDAHVM